MFPDSSCDATYEMNSNVVNNMMGNVSDVIVKMVDEMKVTIATAIRKIAVENPAIPPPPTAEEAREAFIEMLLKELFGEASVSVPMTPVAVKAPEKVPEKPKKPRAPRAKKEKAPEAVPEVDSVAESVPDAVAEPVAEVKEAPKKEPKAKKPAAKKEKPAAPAAPAAPAEPKTVNIDKLTPTHTKKIKAIADEIKVAVPDKKLVLAYLNGLTSEVYNSKKMDEHLRTFLTPPAAIPAEMLTLPASPKEDEDVPEDYDDVGNLPAPVPNMAPAEEGESIECIEVVFKGKVYYVDPTTKKVYNDTDAYVGDVGVNLFKGMVLPA
jgi:hypothetical protein